MRAKRVFSLAAVAASTALAACGSTKGSSTATTPPSASSTATNSSTTPTGRTKTVDGPTVNTQFGAVQVEAVVQGSQIVDVKALQLPFDRPRSQFISTQAEPLLRSEALHAQSANIQLLSGATFTSEAYAQSLQGALAQR